MQSFGKAMVAKNNSAGEAQSPRGAGLGRFQFSLRTFLIVITLSAALIGLLLARLHPNPKAIPRSQFFDPPADAFIDDRHGNEIYFFQRERSIHVIIQSFNGWHIVDIERIENNFVNYAVRPYSSTSGSIADFRMPLRAATLSIATVPGVACRTFDLPNVDLDALSKELNASSQPVLTGSGCIGLLETSKLLPPSVRDEIRNFLAARQKPHENHK